MANVEGKQPPSRARSASGLGCVGRRGFFRNCKNLKASLDFFVTFCVKTKSKDNNFILSQPYNSKVKLRTHCYVKLPRNPKAPASSKFSLISKTCGPCRRKATSESSTHCDVGCVKLPRNPKAPASSKFCPISKTRGPCRRKATPESSTQCERLGLRGVPRVFRNCKNLKASLDFFVTFCVKTKSKENNFILSQPYNSKVELRTHCCVKLPRNPKAPASSKFCSISKTRGPCRRKATPESSTQCERLGLRGAPRVFRNCKNLKASLDFFVTFCVKTKSKSNNFILSQPYNSKVELRTRCCLKLPRNPKAPASSKFFPISKTRG